jgi:urease accessory protein
MTSFRATKVTARAGVFLCLLMATSVAHAHSPIKGIGGFYAGFLHPVTGLEHVLPFAALGILAGQQGDRVAPALFLFAVMVMLGALGALWIPALPYIGLLNILSGVLLGALVAAARRLPIVVLYVIAIVFGLTHGFANGTALNGAFKPYLFIPGLGLAGLVVPAWMMIVTDLILRQKYNWMRIAVRVAGSWITAIGVLVLATSGRTILHS